MRTSAGQALLDFHVIDGVTFAPVEGAVVRVDPYGAEARTNAHGDTSLALDVPGACRWATITVRATGYGQLEVVDQPIYPMHASADYRLKSDPQHSYIGPPSGTSEGMNMCTR